jgi:predicted nucleic acid-binding protein
LMVSANHVTDHYLVAVARHHHLTLATLDEPLANTFANESGVVQLIR